MEVIEKNLIVWTMENHLEIIIDDGTHSLTKNKEIAEAEGHSSGIVLKCDYLDKRDSTTWSWEKHFIGFNLENAQVSIKNPSNSLIENTKIKLIRGVCAHCDGGKLLVTYLLNGEFKEIVCDSIYRGEGQKLYLKKPKCIEEIIQYFPNRAGLKNNDGYNHILKHSYCFTYGRDMGLIEYMPIESIDTIRIDPYVDSYDPKSYSYNPHTRIGKLPLQIDILGKCVSFYTYLGIGIAKFDSIFEMLQTIIEWRKLGEEGYYPIKVSEISYLDNLSAELSIESDTFSFIDLEEKLDFTVTMHSKHFDNESDDWKSYADDAYEGYSPEYLGLDG